MAAIGLLSSEPPADAPFLSALSYPALRATLNQEPASPGSECHRGHGPLQQVRFGRTSGRWRLSVSPGLTDLRHGPRPASSESTATIGVRCGGSSHEASGFSV